MKNRSVIFPSPGLLPSLLCGLALGVTGVLPSAAQEAGAPAAPLITPDVIYGHKAGMALTYDRIRPEKPNGAAVLFMVSGGWVSQWMDPAPLVAGAMAAKDRNAFGMLLDRGFTLILVRHGSSPYFRVPDAVEDVRRAVRHVRAHAAAAGLDPERLGVFGGSAGGHLSLMLGTTADAGNSSSPDPVERAGNRVAAVVAYYPPTELSGYIGDKRFPALDFPADKSDSVSPIRHVTADDAPSLLVHGGKDTLVLPSHSDSILAAFKKEGVPADLIFFEEAGHSFTGGDEKTASTALVAWFEKYLLGETRPVFPLALRGPASPAGVWSASATLPDGSRRPATLTFEEKDGKWTGRVDGEEGAKPVDRVQWEGGLLRMELDIRHEGQAGIIRVKASGTAPGRFAGTWSVIDAAGQSLVSGPWEAEQKPGS